MACPHGAAIGTTCVQCVTSGAVCCLGCGQPVNNNATWVGGVGPYHPGCAPNAHPKEFRGTCPKCGHTETS